MNIDRITDGVAIGLVLVVTLFQLSFLYLVPPILWWIYRAREES